MNILAKSKVYVELLFKILWLYFKVVSQVSKIVVVNLNEYFKLFTTDSMGPRVGHVLFLVIGVEQMS